MSRNNWQYCFIYFLYIDINLQMQDVILFPRCHSGQHKNSAPYTSYWVASLDFSAWGSQSADKLFQLMPQMEHGLFSHSVCFTCPNTLRVNRTDTSSENSLSGVGFVSMKSSRFCILVQIWSGFLFKWTPNVKAEITECLFCCFTFWSAARGPSQIHLIMTIMWEHP